MELSEYPLLVFLPGTLCDEHLWQHQVDQFPKSHVINLRTQSSAQAMLEDIAKVKAERFAVVGFSMGGYLAQEFALQYPERVTHIVSIASSSEGYPEDEKKKILASMDVIKNGLFRGITERRLQEFMHPKSYAEQSLRKLIHDMNGPDAREVYLRQLKATLERKDLTSTLASKNFKLTFVAGREDQIVPLNTIESSHTHIPNSQLFIIEECGHFVPLEKPYDLNQILIRVLKN